MKCSQIDLEQFWEIIELDVGLEPLNAEVLSVNFF